MHPLEFDDRLVVPLGYYSHILGSHCMADFQLIPSDAAASFWMMIQLESLSHIPYKEL